MLSPDRVFKLIAEHTTDLVCIHDRENTIRFASPSSKSVLGREPSEVTGKKFTDFLTEDFINEMDFSTLMRFFDQPGARIRYQVKHGDNRLRWLETTFTDLKDEELENYSALSTTRDITESVHLTDDLMDALAKEQELSKFKTNLYSIASHEFKTPLAVIQANIEALKVKRTEKMLDNSLTAMEEEIERLNDMIADMLELKKLTSGRVNFKPEPLDIKAMVDDVIEKDKNIVRLQKGVQTEVRGAEQAIEGDYSLIRYIFTNLIANALKFSPKEDTVWVQLIFEPENLTAKVIDKGIGIPEENQASIFQSFYRGENVGNIPGTGVGLSIVKEFINLHKGKINVNSETGKGSTFTVIIPNKQS